MSTLWFIYQNDLLLLITQGNQFELPKETALSELMPHFLHQYSLGQFHNNACYCAEVDPTFPLADKFTLLPVRKALDILGKDWYQAAVKSYAIIHWDKNHQYCGHCGNPTAHTGSYEKTCTVCGLTFYPRISPSAIVRIAKGDHILMARSPHFTPGAYGLIAGFVEVGENVEETIHREVKEEVAIEIKNLRYFGSQPWPFPDSLMLGFTADYAAGEIQIDHHEIEAAGWYRYDNLPGRPSSNVSLSRKLIDHFVAEQMQKTLK